MKPVHAALAALPLALLSLQASACYKVYDGANRVVYNAQQPPVNMSYNIHETLPQVYPGGHMVFDMYIDCPISNQQVALSSATPMGARSPAPRRAAPAAPAAPAAVEPAVAPPR
jgi:hypothetical protein